MIRPQPALKHPPPRLSMDEYAEFVEASLRESDPVCAARQKKIEKRIRTPFRMDDAAPPRNSAEG